ncbi:MAG: DUF4328 domain-containing protein [Chloroflexi bacterium]|nr:DUF4328 domain-containing protein [Chloroflexota bacterium]
MQQGKQSTEDPLKPRWPWEVVRARQRNFDPANPLRYSHNLRLATSVLILAVLLTLFVNPARTVETDMLADVEAAKVSGFPQLPPPYASPERIAEFVDEWNLDASGSPSRQQIESLSVRIGEYGDDSALLNLGISASLIGILFISAVAFSRASNNLYALGYPQPKISTTWAAVSWFVPLLSFVLPWMVVSEIFRTLWTSPDDVERSPRFRLSSIAAGLWGLSFIGLWLLNPASVHLLLPANDIDDWLSKIAWAERMMTWLPITTFITAAALLVVSVKQHRRYRLLDARAAASS